MDMAHLALPNLFRISELAFRKYCFVLMFDNIGCF